MKTRIQITASVKLKGSLLLLGEMMQALQTTLCSQHYIETYIIKSHLNSGVTETNTMEPKTSDNYHKIKSHKILDHFCGLTSCSFVGKRRHKETQQCVRLYKQRL